MAVRYDPAMNGYVDSITGLPVSQAEVTTAQQVGTIDNSQRFDSGVMGSPYGGIGQSGLANMGSTNLLSATNGLNTAQASNVVMNSPDMMNQLQNMTTDQQAAWSAGLTNNTQPQTKTDWGGLASMGNVVLQAAMMPSQLGLLKKQKEALTVNTDNARKEQAALDAYRASYA